MTGEIDIYRSAQVIINKRGEEAEGYARSRVRGYVDDGEIEGAAVWQMITNAIVKLQELETNSTIH